MLEDIVQGQGEVTQAGIWGRSRASSRVRSDWSIDVLTESSFVLFIYELLWREHEYDEAACF